MNTAKAPANEPIDAVYTWVDGSDPKFQEQLRQYRDAAGGAGHDAGAARFHDNDELRFSLRSLERNAPWIRKVYLVTNGQAPAWIDRSHPRLALIRHEDLFPDRRVLPVFNSMAIEWQLFRIPGLSRQFLYFHDDFFLGRRVTPADFQTPKNGYRVFVEPFDIPSGAAVRNATDAALAYTETLLNSRFGNRSPRKNLAHTPRFLDRTFLEEVNRIWEGQIRRTAAHRFRDPQDVSMETLYFYYLLECPQQFGAHEQTVAVALPKTYRFVPLSSRAGIWKRLAALALERPKFFCLNDDTDALSERDTKSLRKSVRMFLKLYYWRRSSFEA